jgi:hypothetical protein
MSERARNLARSRRKAPVKSITVLTRIHEACQHGMHIACPGTVGTRRPQDCLCDCHKGVVPKLRAAR